MLLTLRRTVSSKSKSLHVHNQKSLNDISSEESLSTCSFVSIKDDVSGQDSGLDTNEMQNLKEGSQALVMENTKLKSELLHMAKTTENQRATIEKMEEDLQGSKRKCKMLEDHTSLLALHAHELSERRALLEDELQWREQELGKLKMINNETIRRMEEDHTSEQMRDALKMKGLEETAAALELENANLKKELEERDNQNEVKDIVNALICESVHESVNKELVECRKKNTRLEEELLNMKTQLLDKESKLDESVRLLKEANEESKLCEEGLSLLTIQVYNANKAIESFENEVAVKETKVEDTKIWNEEESRRLADEVHDQIGKVHLRNNLLEEEIAKHHTACQAEVEGRIQEKEVLLTSSQGTFDTKLNSLAAAHENEVLKYKEAIETLQMRIKEGDDKCSSLLENQRLLDVELSDTQRELVDLKMQHDRRVEELKRESSIAHIKFLDEQAEKVGNSNTFKSKLKSFMEKCCTLENANIDLEEALSMVRSELESKEERIEHLDQQLVNLYDRLQAKDIVIEQLSMKKPRRRGLRRILCC